MRTTLAVVGGVAVVAFIGWHLLVWQMGEVYAAEGGTPARHGLWPSR